MGDSIAGLFQGAYTCSAWGLLQIFKLLVRYPANDLSRSSTNTESALAFEREVQRVGDPKVWSVTAEAELDVYTVH